jgi:hypothetical protein
LERVEQQYADEQSPMIEDGGLRIAIFDLRSSIFDPRRKFKQAAQKDLRGEAREDR